MTAPDPPPDDDPAWLAFQYLAGELDGRSRAAYEARLEHDPAACAALAEAVELAAACLRLRSPIPARTTGRRAPVLAIAAVLLLAIAVLPSFRGHRPGRDAAIDGHAGPAEVIALERAWSRLHEDEGMGEAAAIEEQDPAEELAADLGPLAFDEAGDADPPGWLLVAVDLAANPPAPAPLEN